MVEVKVGRIKNFDTQGGRPPLRNLDILRFEKLMEVFGLLGFICCVGNVEVDLARSLEPSLDVVVWLAYWRGGWPCASLARGFR